MMTRYGDLSNAEFEKYKERLHDSIHLLLIHFEKQESKPLGDKFRKVQLELIALSSLMDENHSVLDVMVKVEAARVLFEAEGFNQNDEGRMYRKMVMDAHEALDRII